MKIDKRIILLNQSKKEDKKLICKNATCFSAKETDSIFVIYRPETLEYEIKI